MSSQTVTTTTTSHNESQTVTTRVTAGGTPAPSFAEHSHSEPATTKTTTLFPHEQLRRLNTTQVYFERVIRKYVFPDVQRLTEQIRPDDNGLRGCTVPLAMMLFAVADLFGFLMRSDIGTDLKSALKDTGHNVEWFLQSQYFDVDWFLESAPRPEHKEKAMYKVFRCGLVHEIFPKSCGIAKAGMDLPLIYYDDNDNPILNVDVFSKGVLDALKRIEAEVMQSNDPDLLPRMDKRLSLVFDQNRHDRDTYFS